jgi:hypothetical protein
MGIWSGSILLNQGQGAIVRALVEARVGESVIISVDVPLFRIESVWDGTGFETQVVGEDYVAGYAVSLGDGEISYLVNYVTDVGVLSTVTIDAQVKEASVSLAGGLNGY